MWTAALITENFCFGGSVDGIWAVSPKRESKVAKITIDNKEYDTDTLSDDAKKALGALQFTEMEIQRLQAQLAAMQTARMVYANGLKQALEKSSSTTPDFSQMGGTIKFS